MERNTRRLEHLGTLLTGAVIALAICVAIMIVFLVT
jgi:hypothetical protein